MACTAGGLRDGVHVREGLCDMKSACLFNKDV